MSSKTVLFTFIGLFLSTVGQSASKAAIITFNYTGTVNNRFNNGLPDPSDIFGLTVNVGDAVTGSFTLDTAAPLFGSLNGALSGSAAGYTQSLPLNIRANLGGGLFTSEGDFASSIANDLQDNATFPVFEQLSISDGVSSGFQNITGDTILLNGNQETARFALTFTDNDATAFDSILLPTSLDLGEFEIAEGTISGTRPSGQANPLFYSATFSIDTLTVSAVPEPSTMAFLACVAGGAAVRVSRRVRTTCEPSSR
jgi:hypothetical protein